MRRLQSLFKTLLMLVPMTAVPVMAIFGIPQFFPVSASPFERAVQAERAAQPMEHRAGQSDALQVRSISTEPAKSLDLFQPYDASVRESNSGKAGVVANAASSELARRRIAWQDPLAGLRASSTSDRQAVPGSASRFNSGKSAASSAEQKQFHAANRSVAESFSGQAAVSPRRSTTGTSSDPEIAHDVTDRERSYQRATNRQTGVTPMTRSSNDPGRHTQFTATDQTQHRNIVQAEAISWRQAVDRLNELGIRTYRLAPDSKQNGYRFVCLVTSIDDPRISRRFESESPDPLAAVGNVLAQVENWNLHQ